MADAAKIILTSGDAPGSVAAGTVDLYTTSDKLYQKVSSGMATEIPAGATTGIGNIVRSISPTLVTPLLGTPSSGVLTNCTTATAADDTSTTAIANTAFVQRAIDLKLPTENLLSDPGTLG